MSSGICPITTFFPRGAYTYTRNRRGCIVMVRQRPTNRPFRSLYRGDWLPIHGYAQMAKSNQAYLRGCMKFWKEQLTYDQQSSWRLLNYPGVRASTRFQAWNKANQGKVMVNPRIDQWTGTPPFYSAPQFWHPPTMVLNEAHLWINYPEGPESALEIDVTTTPADQPVQLSASAFHRSYRAPSVRRILNDFNLVDTATGTGTTIFSRADHPNFAGLPGCKVDTHPWNPPTAYITVSLLFLVAHGQIDWPEFLGCAYFLPDAPTSPPGGPGTVQMGYSLDWTGLPSGDCFTILTPTYAAADFAGVTLTTPGGSFNLQPPGVSNNINFWFYLHRALYAWEWARHVIGMPRAGDYCLIGLRPVSLTDGSPGDTTMFSARAEVRV